MLEPGSFWTNTSSVPQFYFYYMALVQSYSSYSFQEEITVEVNAKHVQM